uniref:Fucosyltransferase C-terminal domain-containing protein n=1 Tax=viral metagenome TaxID=1070528 RepID=A0A6C0AQ76_9ZZZZ
MSNDKYYIFPYNWWPGFNEKTDANHIGFFQILLSKTKLKNFEIIYDINKANVLLEAGNPNEHVHNLKNWKYKINFIGEPALPQHEKYDLVLTSVNNITNIVDLPLSVAYIHCNNFLPKLLNRQKIDIVPQNFCSFIVSNPKCIIRNKLFEKLNNYKKVNSMGGYANNVDGQIRYPYWSQDYFNVIGSHKFMICCENTKMETYSTEKIVNPYLARTIPIYWGSHNIKNIFNPDSMLFLEDETDEAFKNLIKKIIELDNDDEKYLEFINRQIFTEDNIKFWNENYILESLARKIDEII